MAVLWPGQAIGVCSRAACGRKAVKAAWVKAMAGRVGLFESAMKPRVGLTSAISTHCSPAPLNVDLCHSASRRSAAYNLVVSGMTSPRWF